MGEETLVVAQERAFALHAPKLLQEGEGDDLGVREALYGLVASSAARVEEAVAVVYEAEKHGRGHLPGGAASGYACIGPSEVPFVEGSDGPRCTVNPGNTHLVSHPLIHRRFIALCFPSGHERYTT